MGSDAPFSSSRQGLPSRASARAAPRRVSSVGGKLASATIVLMMVATVIVYSRLSSYQREHLLQAKQMAAQAVTRLFAASCAAAIVFGDNQAIKDALYRLGKGDDIPYAAVWSADASGRADQRLAELKKEGDISVGAIPADMELRREPSRLVLLAPVRDLDDKLVGVAVVAFSLVHENGAIAQVESNILAASAAIAIGLTILLLTIARFAIVRPLGKLVVAANRIERGLASDIEVRSHDEIGQLALAFRSMARAINTREERIVARNRDMRLVLDNVEQGFLTLDLQARHSEERSRVVDEWFGAPEPGAPFWSYLARIDPKAGERFEVGWTLITDNLMPLEASLDLLPKRIQVESRLFELSYRPILKEEALEQLLVVITDVTARIERERALVVERETMSVFKRIMSDRSVFEEFFEEATVLVARIRNSDGLDLPGLQRAVHTLKGSSATYGIESVADLCHTIEYEIGESAGVVSDERKRELRALWARVDRIRAEFSAEPGVTVRRDEHRALLQALEARGVMDLAARLASWEFEPASRRLELIGKQIESLARRLGKGEVQVRIMPTDLRLPAKRWAALWNAMSHIARNTADHGLDTRERRIELGKPERATVTLSLTHADSELILSIGDDGRGIDWAAIAARGKRLGLPVDTRDQLKAALFAHGVSSRESITPTSGRGVGLSAVLDVVNTLGGRIEVHSELGKGATFAIHLPAAMLSEERGHAPAGPPSSVISARTLVGL
jgi:two-component system chemotaxis sensor kinase CheA